MVVKLDTQLQGLIDDVAAQLHVGSTITLQPPSAGTVVCSLVDGRTVGALSVEQVQHLPVAVRAGVVRSLRKQNGRVSEVLVRFTASPTADAVPQGIARALASCAWPVAPSACIYAITNVSSLSRGQSSSAFSSSS